MDHGSFIRTSALLTAAAAGSFSAMAQETEAKPNVVLLFIDDLGYADIGPFGCKDIPTPNIDRLAREGTTLTQAYVTNPPCCPSRSSLMMGMYGQHFGKYGMSRGLSIPDDKPTLAEGGSSAPYRGGKGKGTQQVGWTLSPTIMSWPGVIPQGRRFDGLSCAPAQSCGGQGQESRPHGLRLVHQ